jgi:hypothetical protein
MVAIASAIQFLWNAWPHTVKTAAGPHLSDGARILKSLRGKNEAVRDARGLRHSFRAWFAFVDREFAMAAREAAKARVRTTDPQVRTSMSVLGAAAMSESDDAPGALELLRAIDVSLVENPGVRAGVLDNLGWATLLLGESDLYESGILLAEEACDIAPWEDSYVITLACLYAASATPANGRAGEARKFLTALRPKATTQQNAAYVALAHGLCAVAEGDVAAAQMHYASAKSRGATAAPLRLLERRLASR